jgi:hypothetical protein
MPYWNFYNLLMTWVYTNPPWFHKATCINLSFFLTIAVISASLIFYFHSHNAEKHKVIQGLQQLGELGKGDGS